MENLSKNLTAEYLIKIIEKHHNKHWNWESISINHNITMEIIEKLR